jgi:hypothetical protein
MVGPSLLTALVLFPIDSEARWLDSNAFSLLIKFR